MSLLSFPSLDERSELGFFWLVLLLLELLFPIVLELLELLELFLLLLFLFLLELGVGVLLALVPLPLLLEHSGFGVAGVSLATSEWCSQ